MSFSSEKSSVFKKQVMNAIVLLLSSVLIGVLGGGTGALFVKSIAFVTQLRETNGFILYLLPLGGLVSVGIYKLTKMQGIGTISVIESAKGNKSVPILLMPAIFLSTVITHLFGGSAGKEGAALQLGGAVSSLVSKLTRADENKRRIYVICGMAALFSAAFGTPVGACIFALEVVASGVSAILSSGVATLVTAFISSVVAYIVSCAMGVHPERFELRYVPDFGVVILFKMLAVAVAAAAASALFCFLLHKIEKLSEKIISNPFIRIFIGGCIVILLSLIFGRDYNGGGISVIESIFEGVQAKPEAFLMKIIFTVITVSFGFRGGEIVPSLFIGATLGSALSSVLDMPGEFAAAIGMTAFFGGVTNCPLAAAVLGMELFGTEGLVFFIIAAFVSRLVSGKISLYEK